MGNLMEVAWMTEYKKRFTLTGLSAKWNKSEEDILQKAEDGELMLSIWWSGFYNEYFPEINRLTQDRGPLNDFVNIGQIYATKFLELNHDQRERDKGAIEIGEKCFLLNGQHVNLLIPHEIEDEIGFPKFVQSDLRVLAEEVERFERENHEWLMDATLQQENNDYTSSVQKTGYDGRAEIEAAFKSHKYPIKYRRIFDFTKSEDNTLNITYPPPGKKQKPHLEDSDLKFFIYNLRLSEKK